MKDYYTEIFSSIDLQQQLFDAIKTGIVDNVKIALLSIKELGQEQIVSEPKNFTTPLVFAIKNGNHPEIIQLLLENGASSRINTPLMDTDKNTPLHIAVRTQPINIDVIRLLLEHGAFVSVRKKNAQGKTPVDIYPGFPWKLVLITDNLYTSSIKDHIEHSYLLNDIEKQKKRSQAAQTALAKQRGVFMKQKQRCKKKYPVLSIKESVSQPQSELDGYLHQNYPITSMGLLNHSTSTMTLEDIFWGSTTSPSLRDNLYLFHGTDALSRRSFQKRGVLAKVATTIAYGPGFYTTPSPEEAVKYAFSKHAANKGDDERESIAPILLVLRISRQKAQEWVYPHDFNISFTLPYVILKNQEKLDRDIELVDIIFLERL